MALKGSQAKEEITKKILETFDGSFKYEKEIRIPIMENGELIQIKCVLTAAKTNVEKGGDVAIPNGTSNPAGEINFEEKKEEPVKATEEEMHSLAELLNNLNL